MKKNEKGVALIELVALATFIVVLVAAFLPRYAASAVRTENAAALSDLRNAIGAQETLKADWGKYGTSAMGLLPGPGAPGGAGMTICGPAYPPYEFLLTLYDASWTVRGIAIQLSNGVCFVSNTNAGGPAPESVSYTMIAKHNNGDQTFGADSDSKVLFRSTIIGAPFPTGYRIMSADGPASVPGAIDFYQPVWMTM